MPENDLQIASYQFAFKVEHKSPLISLHEGENGGILNANWYQNFSFHKKSLSQELFLLSVGNPGLGSKSPMYGIHSMGALP
jgi:hypothetical protein